MKKLLNLFGKGSDEDALRKLRKWSYSPRKPPERPELVAFLTEFMAAVFLVRSGETHAGLERAAQLDQVSESAFEVRSFVESLPG